MALSSRTQPIASIVARPDSPSAWIRLAGDIDMDAEPALANATDRLNRLPLRLIVIDLTTVTFMCSTLANFLAALHRTHPDAELVLHHPSRLARVIVTVTDLDRYVVMSRHPGSPMTYPGPDLSTPPAIVPCTTTIAPINTPYPRPGASAGREPPGRWEAINRQPGRTHGFGGTGKSGNSAVAMIRHGARSANRRLVDGARFAARHRQMFLHWITRTKLSERITPPGPHRP